MGVGGSGVPRAGSRGKQRPDQGKVRSQDCLPNVRGSLGEEEARNAPV